MKGTAAMRRRRLRIGRVLDCFSSSLQCAGGCVCVHALDDEEDAAVEREALVASGRRRQQQVLRLRDLVDGTRTLGFHLQPKVLQCFSTAMSCSVAMSQLTTECLLHHRIVWCVFLALAIRLMFDADGRAEGVHALQRLRQEGSQAHLQDGRYNTNLHLLISFFFVKFISPC